MNGLDHVDDYPEIPVSFASTSTLLKTGAWRSVRPVLTKRTAPCSAECPAGIDIPAYLDYVRLGRLEEARNAFSQHNPFPRITGRVCPHFCEHSCNLTVVNGEESVSIRSIERWLGDETADIPHPLPEKETGKQVAVVGAGPAGMAAAFYLRRSGHRVTVFERREHPGGIMRYGIPEYRLPTPVVDEEVSRLEEMGVEFRTNVALGSDFTLEDLEAAYTAVFVATGAAKERHTEIRGESLLEPGLPFLEAAKRDLVSPPGERCAVIGGGNTAMDVARVLRRMGAAVTVLYRRTADEMPAIAEEYERAVDDKVAFEWLVLPKSIEKLNGELLVTVEHMRLGEPDDSGRRSPEPTGVMREMRFHSVFAAIGETADIAPFPERMRGSQGWLDIDAGGATKDPFVYAGGDLATGPATVIEAIVAGRSAAQAIDEHLGFAHMWPLEEPEDTVTPAEVNPTYMPHHERSDDHEVETVTRFSEETNTLTEAEVLEEIDRCLSCGHCNSCGTCFVFCPDGAIIWDEGPRIDHEFCKGCGICVAECPGHVMVLVNEREVSHV
jgi:NADPH-dependent glutamate synthase beta subunit-like oxidoreductase/Pyruvate/2-oxoacid:ferredoxin oxidoreductase delta subunit